MLKRCRLQTGSWHLHGHDCCGPGTQAVQLHSDCQIRFSPTTRLIRSLADAESTRRVKIMVEGLSTLHFPTALEPAQASLRQACASPGLSPVAGSVQWPCRSRHPTHCGSP